MPTSKQIAVTKPTAPEPKAKKHIPPPPGKPGKPGKKHPKKHEKDHEEKHDGKSAAKHLRRAFEHLGRVEALQGLAQVKAASTLVQLAQASIDHQEARPAADLLRAAEHLSFAAIAAESPATAGSTTAPALSPELEEAIRREFRKLLEHAEEHDLPNDSVLGTLLRNTLDQARAAFDGKDLRQALELARAAEALSSIERKDVDKLDPPAKKRALKRFS